jgi:hypothetical protein
MVVNIWIKVIYAAVVALLSGVISALQAGKLDGLGWLIAILAAIVAAGGVLGLGNTKDPGQLKNAAQQAAMKANNTFKVT